MEKKIVPTQANWFLIDGRWHHCVVVRKGNELSHYVDGKYTHKVCQTEHQSVISEVAYFDRVLTKKEIKELYNHGKGLTYKA